MNNGNPSQHDRLEKLLSKARLPEPSSEFKERIVAEARRVWHQTSEELSWRIPFMRLVASTAAAVFVIWLANFYSDYTVARWQTSGPSETSQQPSELEVLPEIPYAPFVRHHAAINREYPATDASELRHYVEALRRLLDETQQNRVTNLPTPIEGRSRLLPERSNPSSYS